MLGEMPSPQGRWFLEEKMCALVGPAEAEGESMLCSELTLNVALFLLVPPVFTRRTARTLGVRPLPCIQVGFVGAQPMRWKWQPLVMSRLHHISDFLQ